ncbi:MAG TPA: ABC transporter substrate-binding protein [Micromonosporaceae bacterium]|jgi:branched-chain amino acid transport system substrate-binding protein
MSIVRVLRRWRALFAAGLTLLLALSSGCSGSSLNPAESRRDGPIRIGLMWPTSGVLAVAGDDFIRGWDLYLKQHDNRLGGFDIATTMVDEADGLQAARDGIRKLIDSDHIELMVGTVSQDAMMSVLQATGEAKIPFIGTGGRMDVVPNLSLDYAWYSSFRLSEPGRALVDYVRSHVDGPVWAIGPDFAGGYGFVNGFVGPFTAAGGVLANPGGKPTWTPYPNTTNFVPYLNQIAASDAKAAFAFFGGANAIAFIKQYDQVIGDRLPLYVTGVTTEGNAVLAAMGEAADGVYSSLNYAPDLDNPANREFAAAFQAEYGETPAQPNMQGWDAALVLDLALAAAGPEPTSESVNAAIAGLGVIPSPRGDWRFAADHAPTQPWYLRQVRIDGRGRANVVIETLTVLGGE